MKKRRKTYLKTGHAYVGNGRNATILVYGELWETETVDGIFVQRVGLSRDGKRIIECGSGSVGVLGAPYAKTKYFNMGWAICSPDDEYNEETGIKIAKSRFLKSPLSTQSGTFLTNDMIDAILDNEIRFIQNNLNKFYHPKDEENTIKFQAGDFVIKNVTQEELDEKGYESYLNMGTVRKDNGETVELSNETTYAKFKDGSIFKRIDSGANIVVSKKDVRLANEEEIKELYKVWK